MSDGADDGSDEEAALAANWASVVRAVDAVQHAFAERLEPLGMTLPYFAVLTRLLESADRRLPMSRIARDLSMTSGGFTKLADRMARDGLIDRRGSSGDRRVVFAALSDAGLDQARQADAAYRAFLRDAVATVVSGEDLETLARIVTGLAQVAAAAATEAAGFELTQRPAGSPDRRTGDGEP